MMALGVSCRRTAAATVPVAEREAVALGADRHVLEKHMADEPGPGFADEADLVVVLVEVELARWWPKKP